MIQLASLPRMTGNNLHLENGLVVCGTTRQSLLFLTNAIGEIAHWDQGLFEELHIPYGMCAEEPYPLTEHEQEYMGKEEDNAPSMYPGMLLTCYSIWWQGQKWFCPTLEYCYPSDDPAEQNHGMEPGYYGGYPNKELLRFFVEQEAIRLHSLLIPLGGTILLDLEGLSDRYILHLPIPCTRVLKHFVSGEQWMDFLFALFPITS